MVRVNIPLKKAPTKLKSVSWPKRLPSCANMILPLVAKRSATVSFYLGPRLCPHRPNTQLWQNQATANTQRLRTPMDRKHPPNANSERPHTHH